MHTLKGGISLSSGPIWGPLILQVVLIFMNAFFAMTEIAIISMNDAKIRLMAEEGDKRAVRLHKLTAQPAHFLATIQVGVTLAGFLGSAFAAENFSDYLVNWLISLGVAIPASTLNTIAVIVITIILSYVTLVLGELVPKRLGMKYHDKLALGVAGIIQVTAVVTKPIVWLLTISTNGILRLLGINPNENEEDISEEEIRMMVDLGEEKGAIESGERKMIDNIFEFNNKTAEEVMTHRTDMVVFWLDQPFEEIEEMIVESGHSRFPVCGEDTDDVLGILHVRNFYRNLRSAVPKPLQEILRPAYFVPDTIRTDVLFRDMQKEKVHLAIVVDEYGGTSGLVTMEDLLEEIVGSIYDEYDPAEAEYETLDEETWRLPGTMELSEVSELVGVELPDEDYDTLGGLIFGQLNTIPEEGSHPELDIEGLHIRVERMEDRRVEWALVHKLPKPEGEPKEKSAKDKRDKDE